ncbi:MAG: hypothetical protein AAF557_01235 [Pseudomonadota bacterium]
MVRYCVLESIDLLYMQLAGQVDITDVFDVYERFKGDPKYKPSMQRLTDVREMTGLVAEGGTTFAIKNLAESNADQDQSDKPPLKVVLVNSALIHGLARQYETFSEGLVNETMVICESETDALSALGRDERSIAALVEKFSPLPAFFPG